MQERLSNHSKCRVRRAGGGGDSRWDSTSSSLTAGEGHVHRLGGSNEDSLERQWCVEEWLRGSGCRKGPYLGGAGEEESTVSGKEKSRLNSSFYLFREK